MFKIALFNAIYQLALYMIVVYCSEILSINKDQYILWHTAAVFNK